MWKEAIAASSSVSRPSSETPRLLRRADRREANQKERLFVGRALARQRPQQDQRLVERAPRDQRLGLGENVRRGLAGSRRRKRLLLSAPCCGRAEEEEAEGGSTQKWTECHHRDPLCTQWLATGKQQLAVRRILGRSECRVMAKKEGRHEAALPRNQGLGTTPFRTVLVVCPGHVGPGNRAVQHVGVEPAEEALGTVVYWGLQVCIAHVVHRGRHLRDRSLAPSTRRALAPP